MPVDEQKRTRYTTFAVNRRAAEAATLRARANQLLAGHGHERALVVAGDLNDEPDAATTLVLDGPPGFEVGTLGFPRPDQGNGDRLWNPAGLIQPPERRMSRVHRGRGELIDHIFSSRRLVDPAAPPQVTTIAAGDLPSIGGRPHRPAPPGRPHPYPRGHHGALSRLDGARRAPRVAGRGGSDAGCPGPLAGGWARFGERWRATAHRSVGIHTSSSDQPAAGAHVGDLQVGMELPKEEYRMAITATIGAVVAVATAVEQVWEKLNTSRTILLEFINNTEHTLRLVSEGHAHGGFAEPAAIEIPGQTVSIFGSQSRSGSWFTGAEGFAVYDITEIPNTTVTLRWNNPFVGGNDCSLMPAGEKTAAFDGTHICGAGNDAHFRYEIRQVRPASQAHSPDYRWVRLEGYAYAPEGPVPRDAVPLHSWWSPGREDNWSTTNSSYTDPVREAVSPDYGHYRLEGYVISHDRPAPEGAVPLHSWYDRNRGDNWMMTNPRYTSPVRERISPDYGHYRHEGWLFSPLRDQPNGTVPVHSWYSPSRGDNQITTNPVYRP